jgi:hypothetical protein
MIVQPKLRLEQHGRAEDDYSGRSRERSIPPERRLRTGIRGRRLDRGLDFVKDAEA